MRQTSREYEIKITYEGVELYLKRSEQALRAAGGWGSQNFWAIGTWR